MSIKVWCHKYPNNDFAIYYSPKRKELVLGAARKLSSVDINELLVLLRRPDFERAGPQDIHIRKVFDPMFNFTYVALTLYYNTYYLEPSAAAKLADDIAALIDMETT